MNLLEIFLQNRNGLRGLAYRMTGSLTDSDDILQEVYLKWSRVRIEEIQNPKFYLYSITSRVCLDFFRKQKARNESYPGIWLPEPWIDSKTERDEWPEESLEIAFLLLLKHLDPLSRIIYLLRAVFDFEYSEIADISEKSPENCRQIFTRARKSLQNKQKNYPVSEKRKKELFQKFIFACSNNDPSELIRLFQDEIVILADGGGNVNAARIPVTGKEKASSFILRLQKNLDPEVYLKTGWVNRMPALIAYMEQKPRFVLSFSMQDDKIASIYSILNPDKLQKFENEDVLSREGKLHSPFYFFRPVHKFRFFLRVLKTKLRAFLKM